MPRRGREGGPSVIPAPFRHSRALPSFPRRRESIRPPPPKSGEGWGEGLRAAGAPSRRSCESRNLAACSPPWGRCPQGAGERAAPPSFPRRREPIRPPPPKSGEGWGEGTRESAHLSPPPRGRCPEGAERAAPRHSREGGNPYAIAGAHMTELLVSPIRPDQIPSAARVMANAFADAPRFRFLVPEDARRPAKLRWFWGASMRACIFSGGSVQVAHEGDNAVLGVALWDSPEQGGHNAFTLLRSGLWAAPVQLGVSGYLRRRRARFRARRAGVAPPLLVPERHRR